MQNQKHHKKMKFSIITVNYNNKEGLMATIESVIHQSFSDYEFIVIDGGSSDGSVEIIKEYEKYITYWVSERDRGIYNAMNKGIIKASGEYLNFMNSGDCFYDPDVLKKVASYNIDDDFIVGKDYHHDINTGKSHISIHPPRTTMIHFFNATIDHQSSFIKRELFKNSLYNENYRLVSDWIFYVEKIVYQKKNIKFIPDIICFREEGGLSEKLKETNKNEIKTYLISSLPYGIYEDYATLSNLDKTSLYRLFDFCTNKQKRRILIICIKIIAKIFRDKRNNQ